MLLTVDQMLEKMLASVSLWEEDHYQLTQVVLNDKVIHIGLALDTEGRPINFVASKRVLDKLRNRSSSITDRPSFLLELKNAGALTFVTKHDDSFTCAINTSDVMAVEDEQAARIIKDESDQISQYIDFLHRSAGGFGLKMTPQTEVSIHTRQRRFLNTMEARYIAAQRRTRLHNI